MLFKSLAPLLCLLGVLSAAPLAAPDAALHAGDNKDSPKLKEPTAKQKQIAAAIAKGHAWQKHVVEEKLFPECKTPDDFVQVIAKVIANPTHHKKLENEREAFFDQKSNTIVIYNPRARDKGTCFRPRNGLKYYENLK